MLEAMTYFLSALKSISSPFYIQTMYRRGLICLLEVYFPSLLKNQNLTHANKIPSESEYLTLALKMSLPPSAPDLTTMMHNGSNPSAELILRSESLKKCI